MLRILFGSAVYKIIFLAADYFSVDVLIGTQIMIREVNSICCIDQQVGFTKGKKPP